MGSWLTAREAAIAVDRAVLHFQLDRLLNFPSVSRRRGPASVQELRRDARLSVKSRLASSSRYMGVRWVELRHGWEAVAWDGKRTSVLGLFGTEKKAAMAWDQVVLHHCGDEAMLTFPRASVTPMPAERMRQLAHAKRTATKVRNQKPARSLRTRDARAA